MRNNCLYAAVIIVAFICSGCEKETNTPYPSLWFYKNSLDLENIISEASKLNSLYFGIESVDSTFDKMATNEDKKVLSNISNYISEKKLINISFSGPLDERFDRDGNIIQYIFVHISSDYRLLPNPSEVTAVKIPINSKMSYIYKFFTMAECIPTTENLWYMCYWRSK
jgi:hypothetical protein